MDKQNNTVVLIVEDDPLAQQLLKYFLQDVAGFCFASSVVEAKRQIENNSVDFILLDLSLEGDENGLDFARYLRQSEKWKKTPIIVITAHAFNETREECLDAGCDDYLSKPFRKDELFDILIGQGLIGEA